MYSIHVIPNLRNGKYLSVHPYILPNAISLLPNVFILVCNGAVAVDSSSAKMKQNKFK